MNLRENIPISTLTTMRLGGPARYVATVTTQGDIAAAYDFAAAHHLPTFVLGAGSNLIGLDAGYPGVLIINHLKGITDLGGGRFQGYAGEILDDFIAATVTAGYSGMEAMSAIPGTLGAAPVQNVGAYGQDISQTLQSVEVYDPQTKTTKTLPAADLDLGYRRSIFNSGPAAGRYFIISLTVQLTKSHLQPPFYTSLQSYIEDRHVTDFSPASIRAMVMAIRAAKLPDPKVEASAGSFFKNIYLTPEQAKQATAKNIQVWDNTKIPAGWLIEHAGLKGKQFHGFKVSDKAALILINESATTHAELEQAKQLITKAIKDQFGYQLEQEPVEIKP